MSNLYKQLIYNIDKAIKYTLNNALNEYNEFEKEKGYIMVYPIKFGDFIYNIDNDIKRDNQKLSKFITEYSLNYIILHYPYIYGDIQDQQYYIIYGNDISYKNNLFTMKEFEKSLKYSGIINTIKFNDKSSIIYICNNGIFCKYTKNSITYWCLIAQLDWFKRRDL